MSSIAVFWLVGGALALGVLGLVFAPVLRGGVRGDRRASHDMQVYRDQLREIGLDETRGVLSADEARGTRIEVSRRLLAAADAEAAETEAANAPRALSRGVGAALIAASLVAATGLYWRIGAPGYGDLPLERREALVARARADRPGQDVAEEMIATRSAPATAATSSPEDEALLGRLRDALAQRPDEIEGRRLLTRSLGALGRWSEARRAQEDLVAVLGADARTNDLVEWAELMILAANGYVSPEAEAALARAMTLDATNPLGRYYSGLAMLQGGQAGPAYRLWTGLLREGPPDAPWIAPIEARIGEVAALAGQPEPGAAPGPTRADVEAASTMSGEDRAAMIGGMVEQLAGRLAADGGPPEDWAQLIRSLGVMGRIRDAAEIWAEAKTAYADDPAALTALEEAAREADLIQ